MSLGNPTKSTNTTLFAVSPVYVLVETIYKDVVDSLLKSKKVRIKNRKRVKELFLDIYRTGELVPEVLPFLHYLTPNYEYGFWEKAIEEISLPGKLYVKSVYMTLIDNLLIHPNGIPKEFIREHFIEMVDTGRMPIDMRNILGLLAPNVSPQIWATLILRHERAIAYDIDRRLKKQDTVLDPKDFTK